MSRRALRRLRIRHALAATTLGLALITTGSNLAAGITATVATLLTLYALVGHNRRRT